MYITHWFILIILLGTCLAGYNASSTVDLMQLLEVENKLAENLQGYAEKLRKKLNLVEESLKQMKNEYHHMDADYETYLGNPLNSLSLIYRLHTIWRKWCDYTSKMQKEELDHILFAERMRPQLPKNSDFEMASRAIDDLISFYDLKPEELAAGNLSGYSRPETALTSMDCFAMGQFCIRDRKDELAQTWLNVSLAHFEKSNIAYEVFEFNRSTIHSQWAELLMRNHQEADVMSHLLQADKSDEVRKYYEEIVILKNQCRDKQRRPTQLHCRYNSSTTPFLRLAPLKMEEMSKDPYMVVYHDVIYESEIDWLHNASYFSVSLVGEGEISSYRSSQDTSFPPNVSQVVRTLEQRIFDMTGLSMNDNEELILLNYGMGGHYFIHTDYHGHPDEFRFSYGDRVVTVLFYLGDVELGGSTIFPSINVSVTPRKRSAVMWYNIHNSGTLHSKSKHSACPVIVGSKYVLTKWINEIDQMFAIPCMKDSNLHSEKAEDGNNNNHPTLKLS